jgi:hypothetical protein
VSIHDYIIEYLKAKEKAPARMAVLAGATD